MKLISWNVNGLRAAWKKGFIDSMQAEAPDVIALQETRVAEDQLTEEQKHLDSYESYWYPAEKKGYSGVSLYTKTPVIDIIRGIGVEEFDREGRVISGEFADFYLVNCYFPNSQPGLVRLDFKLAFDRALLKHCEKLRKQKPVIICGDFNVAHEEIDIARPKDNTENPGFYIDERNWFSELLAAGYVDAFRSFEKEGGYYSWWSYRSRARERNIGWRIDYFVVAEELQNRVKNARILGDIYGSDHCPVGLELD